MCTSVCTSGLGTDLGPRQGANETGQCGSAVHLPELGHTGSAPSSATDSLHGPGQVTLPLWASVFPIVK